MTQSMTVGQALHAAASRLSAISDSPRLDAELLAAHVLDRSRGSLFAHDRDPLSATQQDRLQALVDARERRVPVAYLTGYKGFWSQHLRVTSAVLVPRPETELLVEWGLSIASEVARIIDLGTGSGAIALALASEKPRAQVTATDASMPALDVARANAGEHRLAIDFFCGDWWTAVPADARFDLAISNPPYIAADDAHLEALCAEPRDALTDGGDGLGALRRIVAGAPAHLQPGGWLLLEHGFDQGAAVRALLDAAGLIDVQTRRDLAGHERASGARAPR